MSWSGSWVADRFGVTIDDDSPAIPVTALVGLALRRNPRRAHLLVSTVLGKHVPADPRLVYATGRRLGDLVAAQLSSRVVVLGYAETATGLGHAVADSLDADYLHSTRRRPAGMEPVGGFEEEHSHATTHLLMPDDPALLTGPDVLVLVDDELSTGRTVLNTIAALHGRRPRERYVVAALVDVRTDADRAALAARADELGTRIDVVALAAARIAVPDDFAARAAEDVAAQPERTVLASDPARVLRAEGWPVGTRDGGRHGFRAADRIAAGVAAKACAAALAPQVAGDRVLVLGFEELMYAPLLVACGLADELGPERTVLFSSTTRSPVLAVDAPGYPIRTRLAYPSHDAPADGPGERYAYNVAPPAGEDPVTDIVLVVDDVADTAELHARGGLLAQLTAVCARVHLLVVPSYRPAGLLSGCPVTTTAATRALPAPLYGPRFGSYAPAEVSWLLTDLSAVELEAPTEEREEAIQSGGAHYAESLPIEYQPSPQYQELFAAVLAETAGRLAHGIGVVTELVLAERGHDVVLASLARAGTPIGILVRRWAHFAHRLELPHYAVSIVRGRGIDTVALAYLAAHHDPGDVVFVDGWTGKGAIARELTAAVQATNAVLGTAFSPALAVLADTGSCVDTFGTREDFLIPSACLNSTVSGLVSRTVLNDRLIAPGQFHGAKFYAGLAEADLSATFLDAVTAEFGAVAGAVERDWRTARDSDRRPTWAGWAAVEEIGARYGITDPNLIKPGVGETTRVLLRRVPWRILVRPDAAAQLRHMVLLAEQRGVQVVEVDGLPYSCVGLIRPMDLPGRPV